MSNEQMDPNVSAEINNILAEIDASKHNQAPPQQQQQIPQQVPQQMQQQMPQQMPQQMQQQMPPMQGQQLPPPQQAIPPPQQQPMPPYMYQQQPQPGILDFLQNLLIMGDEIKWVMIIVGLFFVLSTQTSIEFFGKYLPFTINELGNSTIIGVIARGLALSVIFVLTTKFI